jgi:hypothetical protein
MKLPTSMRILDVGPRDGLRNKHVLEGAPVSKAARRPAAQREA